MSIRRTFVAVAVLLMTSVVASAQVQFKPRPDKDPYRNLFGDSSRARQPTGPRAASAPSSPQPAPLPQKPVVVCGMLIVPADPRVDPKIRVAPPAGVEHTMRTVTPSICRPA